MKKLGKNNTSGIIGVRYEKERQCWRAQKQQDGQTKLLGRFSNLLDAASARISYENNKPPKIKKNETKHRTVFSLLHGQ